MKATRAVIDPRTPHTRRGLHHDSNEDGSITIRLRLPAERAHEVLAAVDAALDDEARVTDIRVPTPRPHAWIENGPALATGTAARLTCTAAAQAMLVDRRGNPLHLGRRRRTVSRAQLRALRVRDRDRCVAPGCEATRHLGPTTSAGGASEARPISTTSRWSAATTTP